MEPKYPSRLIGPVALKSLTDRANKGAGEMGKDMHRADSCPNGKGRDCKSQVARARWFDSITIHQNNQITGGEQ